MSKNRVRDIHLKDAITRSSRTSVNFMGEDLLLFSDFKDVPIPHKVFKMDCTFAVICYSGSANFALNTEQRSIKQNDIIIVNTGETVESYEVADDFNGMTIFMSKNFMDDIIMNYEDVSHLLLFSRTHPVIHLTDTDAYLFSNYYKMLEYKIAEVNNHFRKEVIRSILRAWIYELSNILYRDQQMIEKVKRRQDVIFAEFLKLVEANFKTEKRVSWYSDRLCISSKYLSAVIKNASQRTPNEWIDYYVILEAKVLLRNTSKSIKEVSEELRFPNQSFFGKFFKERVGCSPLQFRGR
ncbi:MAG: AraC family transcriptional regulator [Prevotella sp.]|nr:AraC family transcriptional regulator [Candidatus Equicola stercoris]